MWISVFTTSPRKSWFYRFFRNFSEKNKIHLKIRIEYRFVFSHYSLFHSVFFSREPQKCAREHLLKSVREYFACAREYKNENVPVNFRSAREPSKKCPWNSKMPVNTFREKCPWTSKVPVNNFNTKVSVNRQIKKEGEKKQRGRKKITLQKLFFKEFFFNKRRS